MFPTAHSTIYYNEEGEVLGWSDDSYYEPEWCAHCGDQGHSEISCTADGRSRRGGRLTPAEERFKSAVHCLLDNDVYPSAQVIYYELGRPSCRRRSMNGRECAWRAAVLIPWMEAHPEHAITLERNRQVAKQRKTYNEYYPTPRVGRHAEANA